MYLLAKMRCGRSKQSSLILISVDTPDPYVQLEVLNNPCGKKKTETKTNNVNPVWNKTFSFVLDPNRENTLSKFQHFDMTCFVYKRYARRESKSIR